MKKTLLLCLCLGAALLLGACASGRGAPVSSPASARPWQNEAVFYEIFVRSFYDSDENGVGDFNGITQKLDYLNDGDPKTTDDLGVTALWLMPIFPSPSYHGYDTTDYFGVNPEYGTLEDFKRLLVEAHKRGMRVVIDLMLNHTSTEHPWFQASLDPASPYRDWYLWSDAKPDSSGPMGEEAWRPGPQGGYYYAAFTEGMPDLNLANPEVTGKLKEATRFWLEEVQVDGFRLDAARYLVEEGKVQADAPANHAWLKDFQAYVKGLSPQAATVGEVLTGSAVVAKYAQGGEMDMAFDFDLAKAYLTSAGVGRPRRALDQLTQDLRLFPAGTMATFLSNHDQDRVMNQLGGNLEKAKTAASMLLTGPGTPFIYYGEEIGMMGAKPDERIRAPMQWNGGAGLGFTQGAPWEPAGEGTAERNVAAETGDPGSLLSHYRALIALRSQHAALRGGKALPVSSSAPGVYALLRSSPEEDVLVVVNLGKEAVREYGLSLPEGPLAGSYRAAMLMGQGDAADLAAGEQGGFEGYQPLPELPAFETLVIRLEAEK